MRLHASRWFPAGRHGVELPYLFNTSLAAGAPKILLSPAQRALAATMRRYWGGFARSHSPSANAAGVAGASAGSGDAEWPQLTPEKDGLLLLLDTAAPLRAVGTWAGEAACDLLWDDAGVYPGPEWGMGG